MFSLNKELLHQQTLERGVDLEKVLKDVDRTQRIAGKTAKALKDVASSAFIELQQRVTSDFSLALKAVHERDLYVKLTLLCRRKIIHLFQLAAVYHFADTQMQREGIDHSIRQVVENVIKDVLDDAMGDDSMDYLTGQMPKEQSKKIDAAVHELVTEFCDQIRAIAEDVSP